MRRAILYARYSPRPRVRNEEGVLVDPSDSITKQYALLQAECDRHGWAYCEDLCFCDEQRSGDDADRPGLWAAVVAVRPGDVFMARDVERIARSSMLLAWVQHVVEEAGGEIVTLDVGVQHNQADTAVVKMIRGILAAVGEFQRWQIAARSRASAAREFERGLWRWGRDTVPYGWQPIDDPENNQKNRNFRIEPVEAQQLVILLIKDYYMEQGLSRAKVARLLNEAGHTWRDGKPWTSDRIKHVLARFITKAKESARPNRKLKLLPGQFPTLERLDRRRRGK
jgi:site-specific DNA recombinase